MSDTPADATNADQIAYWNSPTGERWAAMQAHIDAVFAPLTEALMARAAPAAGEAVLDVGCGAGATVLALAAAVGPRGRVLGVDVSAPMLEVARRRVATRGLAQAEVALGDAATHPFAAGTFDLIASRFGVMFFDDPSAAFGHLRPALRPTGRLAFACWQPLAANPWFAVPLGAVEPAPGPPPDPEAPGPFAFADPERVRRILAGAGFRDVVIAPHRAALPLGSLEETADFLTRIGPTSRALADAAPEARPGLEARLRSALVPHGGPGGVMLGGAIWLVTARAGGVG